jgi:uncharacterized membrane protein
LNDTPVRLVAGLTAAAGVAIAGYLTWAHYTDATVVCVSGGGCETVQESDYSEIAGVPVALLGLISYSIILGLIVWDSPTATLGAAALAFIGLFFGGYLLILQMFVIEAFCVWCVINDVVIAPALAVLTALRLRQPS